MDIYDPQTLGIMVFGGFMVVSAIGIALVSTLSMKETSYEEALAKQRLELTKVQPSRVDKKKKAADKKSKAKKKDEKPNGKLPEQDSGPEPASETSEQESESELPAAPAPISVTVAPVNSEQEPPETKVTVEAVMSFTATSKSTEVPAPPASSPKGKKKKKGAKFEPAPVKPVNTVDETKDSAPKTAKNPVLNESSAKVAKDPVLMESTAKVAKNPVLKDLTAKVTKDPVLKEAVAKTIKDPVTKETVTKESPKVGKEQTSKSTKEPAKGTKESSAKESSPKLAKAASAKVVKEAVNKEQATKFAKESVNKVVLEPASKDQNGKVVKEPAAKAVKESVKAPKEPAAKESITKGTNAKESNTKTAKEQSSKAAKLSTVSVAVEVTPVSVTQPKVEQPKPETPSKKRSKKKVEPVPAVNGADVPLLLPFKTLMSTLRSSKFNDSETQKLLEIISDKAGSGSWQLASPKGDPLAALKKQLEEKEKLLSAEQENAVAAKMRIRELTKELNTEKSKMASVETRLSSELSAREQEIAALHARMKASYDDHVLKTQQLNSKIQSLQDQLENGPKAQLARLQQENGILRDALNKATSMAESRQNTELTTLRQDSVRLNRELNERTSALHAEEERRKTLESKLTTAEEALSKAKIGHVEAEKALLQRLEKVKADLQQAQSSGATLQAQIQQTQQESSKLKELQENMQSTEAGLKERCAEVEALKAQLTQVQQAMEEHVMEKQAPVQAGMPQVEHAEELEQLKNSVKEKDSLVESLKQQLEKLNSSVKERENAIQQLQDSDTQRQNKVSELEQELQQLRDELEQQKTAAEIAEAEQPFENLEKDAHLISLEEELQQLKQQVEQIKAENKNEVQQKLNLLELDTRNSLKTLFPHISIETEQSNWLEAFTLKAQESLIKSNREMTEEQNATLTDTLQKLKQAEESQAAMQVQCEQYRATLNETECILKDLQHSVQDGEAVWKSKVSEAEERLQEASSQVKLLEERVETLRTDNQSTEQLKGQVMLLEAQLEKQLETINFSQSCAQEVEQLKTLLSATQSQLEVTQSEAQKQQVELSAVRHQLQVTTEHVQNCEDTQSTQVHQEQTTGQLQTEESIRLQVEHNYQQAQRCVRDLETRLEELKPAADGATSDLKERLQKEVKLTQELNVVAAKLQNLLKNTQKELSKEEESVKAQQEQIQEKDGEEVKEGTSV